jgi:hypothetical protein
MQTVAQKIIDFNTFLKFKGSLPESIRIMNPFRENPQILPVSTAFYRKFYSDNNRRHLILGINPGRFGAGLTGIPFTDPKRLVSECGIDYTGPTAHEPSSAYVYEMIRAYGGVESFYNHFYISAVCPLGFTAIGKNGKEVNYNYYDSKELTQAVFDFMIENIRKQISMGVETNICFCFGTGKNEKFLREINKKYGFFGEIIALEHPRYIMQYKSKTKQIYIDKYLDAFGKIR